MNDSFREGSGATVIVGSDCPQLSSSVLGTAFEALSANRAVFGPAADGGYYLVGLAEPCPQLFQGPSWGTETVLAESLRILEQRGVTPVLLDVLEDLDRPEDFKMWQSIAEAEDKDLSRISVVIPALNEAQQIRSAVQSVQKADPHQIIVVDGVSRDLTAHLAREAGATVIPSKPGRARQMNAGAALATGNALLFLHADTVLPEDWPRIVRSNLRNPRVVAGAFRFRIAGDFWGKRVVEWITHLRSRWLQMPYGDQALFLRRSLFEQLGGFDHLPILEDYELIARLRRRGQVLTAHEPAITSGRRWQQRGFLRTTIINQLVIAGYHFGVEPKTLARLYRGQK